MARAPFIALLSIALVAPSGCSALFVEGPPPDHAKRRHFDCTSGRAAQTTDLILGGLMGLGAVGAAQDQSAGQTDPLVVIGFAAGLLGSALYGAMQTHSCREAKTELMVRLGDSDTPVAPSGPRVDPWLDGGPTARTAPSAWDAPPAKTKTTVATPPGPATPATGPAPPQAPTPAIQAAPPQAPTPRAP